MCRPLKGDLDKFRHDNNTIYIHENELWISFWNYCQDLEFLKIVSWMTKGIASEINMFNEASSFRTSSSCAHHGYISYWEMFHMGKLQLLEMFINYSSVEYEESSYH